jgi:hypothetical protein
MPSTNVLTSAQLTVLKNDIAGQVMNIYEKNYHCIRII